MSTPECGGAYFSVCVGRVMRGVSGRLLIKFGFLGCRPTHRIDAMDRIENQQVLHIRVCAELGRHEDLLASNVDAIPAGSALMLCGNFAHETFLQKTAEKSLQIVMDFLSARAIATPRELHDFRFRFALLHP